MKCRYRHNARFVPVSWCLNLELLGSGKSWYVQGVLVTVAESWSLDSNRGRLLSVTVVIGGAEPLSPQSEPVPASLTDRPQTETSCPITLTACKLVMAGLDPAVMQQVTLDAMHISQQSNSIRKADRQCSRRYSVKVTASKTTISV